MFTDEIRRTIEVSPRMKLPEVAALLWRAFRSGQISEADAEILQELIDARRAPPVPAPTRRSGTRPRTPASIERRRRWAASGAMPVGIAFKFTIAEQAALAVIADEVQKHGCCDLYIGHIAALAGISETVVRNALREAKRLGLVSVEIRRMTAWRNASNLVTITSLEWIAWLARGGRRGGCTSATSTVSGDRTTRTACWVDRSNPEIGGEVTLTDEGCRGGGRHSPPATPSHRTPRRIAWGGRTGPSGSSAV